MMRFYGFAAHEVTAAAGDDGMLPLDMDPKLAWALKFRGVFPVDINRAPREMLLRVPGLGTKAVAAILSSRRTHALRLGDVARLTVSVKKIRPFIVASDWRPVALADCILPPPKTSSDVQFELFAA
jgi:predicted DNA-binding helix-hairpin-helix protein